MVTPDYGYATVQRSSKNRGRLDTSEGGLAVVGRGLQRRRRLFTSDHDYGDFRKGRSRLQRLDTRVHSRVARERGLRRRRCLSISIRHRVVGKRSLRRRRCSGICVGRRAEWHAGAGSHRRWDYRRRRICAEPRQQCHTAEANCGKHARCGGGISKPPRPALRVLRCVARTERHTVRVQGIAVNRRCGALKVLFFDVFEVYGSWLRMAS